ncbi:hypothetical protein FRC11_007364 [Ceratobasidium sp. 423]|nr:hypothetical protein FRC11_007364 [Ceratobasidium sp. 423]
MVGAAQAVAKQLHNDLDLRSNMRELKEVFKNLFGRTPTQVEPPEQTTFSPGPFDKRHAIRLFRNVLLRNWPFIRGGVHRGYWKGLLSKQTIDLFIPTPLTVRRRVLGPALEFAPSPLHPSPTPPYPQACPTRQTWTAYLSLLDPEELPRALEWMRSIDEFLHTHSTSTCTPLDLFRPERAAIIDALMRWEDVVLSEETPVERAWEEMKKRMVEGVGREGALRAWLIEWLGDEYVPSRREIATARIKVGN